MSEVMSEAMSEVMSERATHITRFIIIKGGTTYFTIQTEHLLERMTKNMSDEVADGWRMGGRSDVSEKAREEAYRQ